jgi:hypothetical protein
MKLLRLQGKSELTMNRNRLYRISVPLLCLVLLLAMTSTSFAAGITQRIRFAPGTTSAQVNGQVDGSTMDTYLLEARAGQQMQVFVSSPYSNVYLTLVSPLGSPLARAQAGAQSFNGNLPESGDYTLQISAPFGTPMTTYIINVSITGGTSTGPVAGPTQRISFSAGSTSAQVSGSVAGYTVNYYLVEASAGQYMAASVTGSTPYIFMSLITPSGAALVRAQEGAKSYNGPLPESGDYTIRVSTTPGGSNVNYTVNVAITGSPTNPGASQRIRFATGATSANVNGQVNGSIVNTYLLEARTGQRMQINLTSPSGQAFLTVVSPNGTPLARAQNGVQNFDQTLPENGDYTLQVSSPAGTPNTTYTMFVSVTNGGVPTPVPGTTQRIRFAPGTSSGQVSGQIDGSTLMTYLLEARAGQRMRITLASSTGQAFLTVVSPFGTPLARAQNGVQSFDQFLPESGDYTLQVSSPAGTPLTSFVLTVSVTNS